MGNFECILLVGPPGSGKSTYCKNFLPQHHRISQDDQGKNRHLEIFKTSIEHKTEKIVIDRMNFNAVQRAKYISLLPDHYTVGVVEFLVPKEVCLERIKNRVNHPTLQFDKAEEVIDFFYKNYEDVSPNEGVDWVEYHDEN